MSNAALSRRQTYTERAASASRIAGRQAGVPARPPLRSADRLPAPPPSLRRSGRSGSIRHHSLRCPAQKFAPRFESYVRRDFGGRALNRIGICSECPAGHPHPPYVLENVRTPPERGSPAGDESSTSYQHTLPVFDEPVDRKPATPGWSACRWSEILAGWVPDRQQND